MNTHTVTFQLSEVFYRKLANQTLKTHEILARGVILELNIELKKTDNGIDVNLIDEDGDIIACQSVELSVGDIVSIEKIKSLTSIEFP